MNAVIVPAVRLRRDTAGWSYSIKNDQDCVAGSLVVIPFRGRAALGVIWEIIADDSKATEGIERVLTPKPLLLPAHRELIEYISEAGLCSLSTALYVWLPKWLREWPVAPIALRALRGMASSTAPQTAIILPNRRPDGERSLARHKPAVLFSDTSAETTRTNWTAINSGSNSLGVGREGALLAPWRNLRSMTVVDPEDISFYHEQIPYLPLTDVARELAKITRSHLQWRSSLPTEAAQALWGTTANGCETFPERIDHLDLQQDPLINDALLVAIQETLARGQEALILYNAHDSLSRPDEQGRRKPLPGVETVIKQLEKQVGKLQGIHLDTRSLFQRQYKNVGLTVALNVDQLLETPLFADQLHGWSDLGHLFQHGGRAIVQSHYPEHPLINALLQGQWNTFVAGRIERRREANLPPFCQQIVISTPVDEAQAAGLYTKLLPLLREPWQLSHPFVGIWRKKDYSHLMLTAPLGERLPTILRKALIATPKPWKLQRSPWHVI